MITVEPRRLATQPADAQVITNPAQISIGHTIIVNHIYENKDVKGDFHDQ